MPWCEHCERFLNPPSLKTDGSCPTCGNVIAEPGSTGLTLDATLVKGNVQAVDVVNNLLITNAICNSVIDGNLQITDSPSTVQWQVGAPGVVHGTVKRSGIFCTIAPYGNQLYGRRGRSRFSTGRRRS